MQNYSDYIGDFGCVGLEYVISVRWTYLFAKIETPQQALMCLSLARKLHKIYAECVLSWYEKHQSGVGWQLWLTLSAFNILRQCLINTIVIYELEFAWLKP